MLYTGKVKAQVKKELYNIEVPAGTGIAGRK
jgi:hypothetical protein